VLQGNSVSRSTHGQMLSTSLAARPGAMPSAGSSGQPPAKKRRRHRELQGLLLDQVCPKRNGQQCISPVCSSATAEIETHCTYLNLSYSACCLVARLGRLACDMCMLDVPQARASAFRAVTPSAAPPALLPGSSLPLAVPTLGGTAAAAVSTAAAAAAAAAASAPAAAVAPPAPARPQKPKAKRPKKPQAGAAKPVQGSDAAAGGQQAPRRAAMASSAAQSIRERAQGVSGAQCRICSRNAEQCRKTGPPTG
jgi:hypothetical protein